MPGSRALDGVRGHLERRGMLLVGGLEGCHAGRGVFEKDPAALYSYPILRRQVRSKTQEARIPPRHWSHLVLIASDDETYRPHSK
jgi:hypothetical protein